MKRDGLFLLTFLACCCLRPYDAHTIEAPDITGPGFGYAEEFYHFQFDPHRTCEPFVLIRCNWGDGSSMDWGAVACLNGGHAWGTPGTYYITAQSGCPDGLGHVVGLSPWSIPHRIDIYSQNVPPTALQVSRQDVPEAMPAGTTIGTFSAVDPNPLDTITFTLVDTDGTTDNDSFVIDGTELKTNAVFDYDTKRTYSIQVRATDHGGLFFQRYLTIVVSTTLSLISDGTLDGWILESSENSEKGGIPNPGSLTLRIGDDVRDRQYRSILSFDTAVLPDNAAIFYARLKVKSQSVVGSIPFASLGRLVVDINRGPLSGDRNLTPTDFEVRVTLPTAAQIPARLAYGWYSVDLSSRPIGAISKADLTQLRVRFLRGDNDNGRADYLSVYSGNATITRRPVLVVQYYSP